jgi:tripartite ATP-independent transporter DctM subunit
MNGLWLMTAVFVLLFLLRVPVFMVLLTSSAVGLYFSPLPIAFSTVPNTLWQGANHFILLAIPFFMLLGDLAVVSGVTARLVTATKAFVGHIAGGLAHVSVVVNMIMAGMSGSDLADAAATGRLLIPAMRQAGYPAGYAASIIGGAAMLGPLIPPSLGLLLYASVTNASVGRLFLAGATPGVFLGLLLMVQAYFTARRNNYPTEPRVPYRERGILVVRSLPVLAIPLVVLGSFFGGIATPTESAVLGVLTVLALGMLFYRDLSPADVGRQLLSTSITVGSIFLIIAAAAVFGRVLTLYGAADSIAEVVKGVTTDPLVFLLLINLLYLLLGCMIDTIPIVLVLVPLIMPTVVQLGIDPVHFGVITIFNLLIGLVTPPYGLTMFLLCKMTGISMQEFWKYMWPIFLTMVVALLAITVFPGLSLWLPNLLLPVR